jgi:hypothetical protein
LKGKYTNDQLAPAPHRTERTDFELSDRARFEAAELYPGFLFGLPRPSPRPSLRLFALRKCPPWLKDRSRGFTLAPGSGFNCLHASKRRRTTQARCQPALVHLGGGDAHRDQFPHLLEVGGVSRLQRLTLKHPASARRSKNQPRHLRVKAALIELASDQG